MEHICFVVPHLPKKVNAMITVSNQMKGSYKNMYIRRVSLIFFLEFFMEHQCSAEHTFGNTVLNNIFTAERRKCYTQNKMMPATTTYHFVLVSNKNYTQKKI
jgi:hypothetical protein